MFATGRMYRCLLRGLLCLAELFEHSKQDEVNIVDLKTGQILMHQTYVMHEVCCISISADGSLVAVGGRRQPSDGDFIPFLETLGRGFYR